MYRKIKVKGYLIQLFAIQSSSVKQFKELIMKSRKKAFEMQFRVCGVLQLEKAVQGIVFDQSRVELEVVNFRL